MGAQPLPQKRTPLEVQFDYTFDRLKQRKFLNSHRLPAVTCWGAERTEDIGAHYPLTWELNTTLYDSCKHGFAQAPQTRLRLPQPCARPCARMASRCATPRRSCRTTGPS